MNKKTYENVVAVFTEKRRKVSSSKREDYTKGSEDVLANFKGVSESTGISADTVLLVYAQKHWDAITHYIKSGGQSESEPIEDRIGDLVNYMELLWAMINEQDNIL